MIIYIPFIIGRNRLVWTFCIFSLKTASLQQLSSATFHNHPKRTSPEVTKSPLVIKKAPVSFTAAPLMTHEVRNTFVAKNKVFLMNFFIGLDDDFYAFKCSIQVLHSLYTRTNAKVMGEEIMIVRYKSATKISCPTFIHVKYFLNRDIWQDPVLEMISSISGNGVPVKDGNLANLYIGQDRQWR